VTVVPFGGGVGPVRVKFTVVVAGAVTVKVTRWRPSASGFVPTLSRRRPDRYQG
jgi:hypothetical protein